MIQEAYVSYDTARLLKEKGFDGVCRYYYPDSHTQLVSYVDCTQNNMFDSACICPTLQMAMKWLRKVHNISLFILPAQENGKLVYLVEVWTWNEEEGIYESTYAPMPRKEPEQAVEAAIKYCLENLI